jgi:A/G-specific adenine glycosylase
VYRVLSRLYDIDLPINTDEGIKTFATLANELLDCKHPGLHNQALMELGALQCVPKNPDCSACPLLPHCLAFEHKTVEKRPVKIQKTKIKTRYFNYLVISDKEHHYYLRKRQGNDIWKNLYDFPCVESKQTMNVEELVGSPEFSRYVQGESFQISRVTPQYTHKLTHQTIVATFVEIKIFDFLPVIQENNILLVSEKEIGNHPIPKLIDNYLNP